jgi:hypothetical protein
VNELPGDPDEVTLGDVIRISRKLKAEGGDSLSRSEWNALERFRILAEPFANSLSKWLAEHRDEVKSMGEGMALYERLSPADQMRFADWTPRQLLAFAELLNFDDDAEPPPIGPTV